MRSKVLSFGSVILFTTMVLVVVFVKSKSDPRIIWEQYLADEYRKISADAGNPDLAALQNYFMTIDPELKHVPSERLFNAYLETKELLTQKENKNPDVGIEWIETGSNMGGRTRALMWDPNYPNATKVWAGSVTGGLWYNNDITNNDSAWHNVNDFWPSLSISSIVADPQDPMTFYAGTGECQTARHIYRESSGVGIGIWKSTDGGLSWEIIPSTEDFKYISDLKVRDEFGTSVLYAGVVSGFYHGINFQSEPNDGLYRSINGGISWEQVLPDINWEDLPYSPADLEIGPEGRIFVGTMKNLEGEGGATILYSDAGTPGTWTVFDDYENIIQWDPQYPVPDRVVLACAPSDPDRVYAIVGAGYLNSTNFNYAYGRYILRSNNGGQSWTERSLPGGNPDWAPLSWHAVTAVVHPTNPNKLHVGGKDVWKSANGGSSWSKISDWSLMYSGGGDEYVHCDQHVQLYTGNPSIEMLFATDGGIFFSDNPTASNPVFEEKNKNYSTLQFYTCAIYPLAGQDTFVGGLQDNGTLLYTGEPLEVDDMIDTGDGAYCFFDETEPQIMITSTYFNSYKLFYNWDHIEDMGFAETGVFINPADYDSKNNILFANAVKFNGTYSNQLLRISGIPNNPYTQLIYLPINLNSYFSHVKVSPYSPTGNTTLFLGSQNGRLFRVVNAQSNPQVTEIGSNDFPAAYLSSVALGSSEENLLVTFSNYGVPSVWQTSDGGAYWQDISSNLPDMPIRWSIYHPENKKMIMLATELGVWATDDASQSEVFWEPEAGFPNVRVDMLKIREADNTVLAATHGRGLHYALWDYDPYVSVGTNGHSETFVFPNPATDHVNIIMDTRIRKVVVSDLKGNELLEKSINNSSRQIATKSLMPGVYLFKIVCEKTIVVERVIIL